MSAFGGLDTVSARGRTATIQAVHAPVDGDSWLGLTESVLPVAEAMDWAVVPDAGAVVTFAGTVRDYAIDDDGARRDDVMWLDYEAYESQVVPVLARIEGEVRRRWDEVRRVALLHRIGRLTVGEVSVAVVVSAGHRPSAFEAGRYAIDALKATVPIWKHESWEGGDGWGTGAQRVGRAEDVASPVRR